MNNSFAFLLTATLLAGDVPRDQIQRDDVEQLQGTWKVEKLELGGQALPAGLFSEMKMIFDGNNLTVMVDKTNKERSRFTLVEGMQPPGIDIEESRGNGKQIIKGIYQLEDDTLRICMEEGNGGTGIRPKSFETKGNDHVILVVLKRVQK